MKIYLNKNQLLTNSIFFAYIYLTLVANYTLYADFITLVFIGATACLCMKRRQFEFSLYFCVDIIFILYSFLQIKYGITVYSGIAQTKVNTLIKCLVINLTVFNFIVIINNFKRILTIYVYAIFTGVITLFIIGWRTLLAGRFLQYTTIYFLGAESAVHSNSVGIVAALAIIFAVFLFFKNNRGRCFIIGGVLLACVFLSGSRKSIVLAAAGLFLLTMYMYPTKKFRKMAIGLIGILLGFLLLMKVPYLYEIAGSRIENTINYFITGKTDEASMSTRNRLIEVGMKYFWQRPKTGYGLDNFRIITNKSKLYAHNNFVELLFSSGIIGFCIYYIKYILLFFKQHSLRLKKDDDNYVTSKMLMCLLLIYTVFEYWVVTYYERDILIVHLFILGFIHIYKNNTVRTDTNKEVRK